MEDLVIKTQWGTTESLAQCGNDLPWCLYCGEPITKETDSGWEGFTAESKGTRSQKICKHCDAESNKYPQQKSNDDEI